MGCVSPENRQYTDPSTVTYEIESLRELSDAIDTETDASEQGTPFIVYNTTDG